MTRPRLAAEWLALLPFLPVMVIGLACGLPINLPDRVGLTFVEEHYFRPLLAAAVVQSLAPLLRHKTLRAGLRADGLFRMLGLLAASVFIHFNFKAWMPLVHRRMFDVELGVTDSLLAPLVTGSIELRRLVAASALLVHWNVDALYHSAFVAMFFVSFTAHALFDSERGLRRLVIAACLVLLIGGMAYWLLPAEGPFLYRRSESELAAKAQDAMRHGFDQLRKTGRFPAGYFASPLAAMPSLHTAHALVFSVFAWRRLRPLGFAMLPLLGWILIEAVASGWHYVLDLPAGAAVAWLAIWLATRLVPDVERATSSTAPSPAATAQS